jgi:hypothetical protein
MIDVKQSCSNGAMTLRSSPVKFLETKSRVADLRCRCVIFSGSTKMPAILLWLLGVPIPVIILLLLLWH